MKEPINQDTNAQLGKRVETQKNWEDLVLDKKALEAVEEIKQWVVHSKGGERAADKNKGPGYIALFDGPKGTGKTLVACLLGKAAGKTVYQVDLSTLVSKYIGETEKNLERLFLQADQEGWILFFDEADALFGKRTDVSSSHDRYANQEVSYLLQRLERFPGLVLFAGNFKRNIDDAFLRRFRTVVYF